MKHPYLIFVPRNLTHWRTLWRAAPMARNYFAVDGVHGATGAEAVAAGEARNPVRPGQFVWAVRVADVDDCITWLRARRDRDAAIAEAAELFGGVEA